METIQVIEFTVDDPSLLEYLEQRRAYYETLALIFGVPIELFQKDGIRRYDDYKLS